MPTDQLIDVIEFLRALDQERYRAVILHAAPENGPAVTHFAQKVCARVSGKYLDLLNLFVRSPDLNEHIDSFGPERLRGLLIDASRNGPLLLVDRADFLLDTWRRREREDFYRMLRNQWDGYTDRMKAKLVICLQSSQEIEELSLLDSHGQNRVHKLSDFQDIV